jgi:hypothetical protein
MLWDSPATVGPVNKRTADIISKKLWVMVRRHVPREMLGRLGHAVFGQKKDKEVLAFVHYAKNIFAQAPNG